MEQTKRLRHPPLRISSAYKLGNVSKTKLSAAFLALRKCVMLLASLSVRLSKAISILIKLGKRPSGVLCSYPLPNLVRFTEGACLVEIL